MSRQIGCALLVATLALAAPAVAQRDRPARAPRDPWAGSWRGQLTTSQGPDTTAALRVTVATDSTGLVRVDGGGGALSADGASVAPTNITITLVGPAQDGSYTGLATGFGPGTEVRLSSVRTSDVQVTVEGATDTAFGPLAFVYSLTKQDQVLAGGGRVTLGDHGFDVSLELKRGRRTDVPQPQIEPRIGYFSGDWGFEYTGGEFPPLSIGTRTGTVSFTALPHGPFVQGLVTGEVFGEPYEETWTIGFDADSQSVILNEQLSTGQQLVSLGDWTSPIAITFLTAPVEADGHVYVLRRLMQTTSNSAFTVTDTFSVDGGPFRRLGNGSYLRAQ